MATCKELQQDYNRLANWFATHESLKGKPEYDGAINKEIKIIKDAQKRKCSWIAAAARKRSPSVGNISTLRRRSPRPRARG